jgi:hypothetical protein
MTNEEAALAKLGPGRAEAYLAGLRASDLADIAKSRGVRARDGESRAELAKRIVAVTSSQASRGGQTARRRDRQTARRRAR